MNDAEREVLIGTLVYHQRTDMTGCACGWSVLGASHAEHVVEVYAMSLAELTPAHPLDRLVANPEVQRWTLVYDGPGSRVTGAPAFSGRISTRDGVRSVRGATLDEVLDNIVGHQ